MTEENHQNLDNESDNDQYEYVEITLRARKDGVTWSEYLFDLLVADCDPDLDGFCTCGLESIGGTRGTSQECWDFSNNLAKGVSTLMVARALVSLSQGQTTEDTDKILSWARSEISFEESLSNWEYRDEEEEGDQ